MLELGLPQPQDYFVHNWEVSAAAVAATAAVLLTESLPFARRKRRTAAAVAPAIALGVAGLRVAIEFAFAALAAPDKVARAIADLLVPGGASEEDRRHWSQGFGLVKLFAAAAAAAAVRGQKVNLKNWMDQLLCPAATTIMATHRQHHFSVTIGNEGDPSNWTSSLLAGRAIAQNFEELR